ncbi:MAG: DUF4404 family protein [Verrucomicrobiales bacterium]
MIEDTLQRLRNRLQNSGSLDDADRTRALELLEQLKAEIGSLPESDQRVQSALHKADQVADPEVEDEGAIGALEESILELEAAHPKASGILSDIAFILGRMGI